MISLKVYYYTFRTTLLKPTSVRKEYYRALWYAKVQVKYITLPYKSRGKNILSFKVGNHKTYQVIQWEEHMLQNLIMKHTPRDLSKYMGG